MHEATMAEWVIADLAEKIAVALVVGTVDSEGRQLMPEISPERCRMAAEEALRSASRVPLVFDDLAAD